MKFNTITLCLLAFLSSTFIFGQIRISEHIQPSEIAKQDSNALYFVDFWATWCGPCIHVSKYLESLQEQFPNDFYVENNKVQSLPYGILYNAKGEELWKGHPADLKGHKIGGFINTSRSKMALSEMFKITTYEKVAVVAEELQEDDFEISDLNLVEDTNAFRVEKRKSYIEFKGNLKDILAYTLNSHKKQIDIPKDLNKAYKMRFKLGSQACFNKTKLILKRLRLKKAKEDIQGEALVFDIKDPSFWDTNQIQWGADTPKYLIGDSAIQADDVSLAEIKYKLTDLLDTPIVIHHKSIDENLLHDWDIHYKYFDLMVSGMLEFRVF